MTRTMGDITCPARYAVFAAVAPHYLALIRLSWDSQTHVAS